MYYQLVEKLSGRKTTKAVGIEEDYTNCIEIKLLKGINNDLSNLFF